MFTPTAYAQSVYSTAQNAQDSTSNGLKSLLQELWQGLPSFLSALVVFLVTIALSKIITRIVVARISKRASQDLNQEIVILIQRTVHTTILVLGGAIAFRILGIDVATLVGFFGLGLGFAFKDLMANFIAGVVILTQKKFKIGDTVRIEQDLGVITEIESRTTQIRLFNGTELIIPNATMLTSAVQNFSSTSFRRVEIPVGVHYKSDLDKVKAILENTVKSLDTVAVKPEPKVIFIGFGDSAINMEVRVWVETTISWIDVRSELIQRIKKDLEIAGIIIPFPMRTISLDSLDETLIAALPKIKPERRI